MIEKAGKGSLAYFLWLGFLLVVIAAGIYCYAGQIRSGLHLTGLSRDISWGLYIAQFTFMVGVAASAVMLVLPVYFHNAASFRRIVILGEFLSIGAVITCLLFVMADMGQPQRVLNVLLHPAPTSPMFWDFAVLFGYLILNAGIAWMTLENEQNGVIPGNMMKFIIYLSIAWAFSIHIVTALLYAGLPDRHYWLSSIIAARFLASAFCSGPALLLLLLLLLKKIAGFQPGETAIRVLSLIITYALCLNILFYALELFTAFYSNIPAFEHPFAHLLAKGRWPGTAMRASAIMSVLAAVLLIPPFLRHNGKVLVPALFLILASTWIDKGLTLVPAGFNPTPFGYFAAYTPTAREILISLGIYASGVLCVTILWKVFLGVKKETE